MAATAERTSRIGRARRESARQLELSRERTFKAFVKRQPPRKARGAGLEVGGPLKILAEGDSWFEYPLDQGGVIDHLRPQCGRSIDVVNLAYPGDEARLMLGLGQRHELERRLDQKRNGGVTFDALLFSGGGNDIAGDQFCLWLNDFRVHATAAQCVNQAMFGPMLDVLMGGLEQLVAIRDEFAPSTTIFFNCYDFPIPTGKDVCFFGPWLKPSLDFRRIPRSLQAAVVREVLQRFGARLKDFAKRHRDVVAVDTQGTLSPTHHWANEIHPNDVGFGLIAEKFREALGVRFPGRGIP